MSAPWPCRCQPRQMTRIELFFVVKGQLSMKIGVAHSNWQKICQDVRCQQSDNIAMTHLHHQWARSVTVGGPRPNFMCPSLKGKLLQDSNWQTLQRPPKLRAFASQLGSWRYQVMPYVSNVVLVLFLAGTNSALN